MKQFDELPKDIQERMLEEQERQGNKRDADVFRRDISALKHEGGIDWADTKEEIAVWDAVITNGNYEPFYRFHSINQLSSPATLSDFLMAKGELEKEIFKLVDKFTGEWKVENMDIKVSVLARKVWVGV